MDLGATGHPQTYLEKDMQIKCESSLYLAWALGIGVPSLIICTNFTAKNLTLLEGLGLPLVLFSRIMFKVEKFNQPQTMKKYHFVFRRYKPNRIYWLVLK